MSVKIDTEQYVMYHYIIEKNKIYIVLMATHGHSEVIWLVCDSVAEKVLQATSRAIFLVRQG